MSWQLAILALLALVLVAGAVWFERSRPSARVLAAVAALAALGVAGRVALAPVPNVVATTDIALLAGYTLGGAPGFAVGALSALISNFWLGQGPWTPWQMAGWGMVGVGGAALATLTARRAGRWGLAAAAAAAGLLYGALLDLSVMVNFGGEQSLDRYLALSARGIPFNVAHALGNAALMLAAGPALVRMLDRYRERSEVDWRRPQAAGAPLAAALLALALAAAALTPGGAGAGEPAAAAAPGAGPARASGAGEARRWLAAAQNRDGGWGISPGAGSNPGMTGWAMLGLEAAGLNPRDLARGRRSPVDYLRRNIGSIGSTGDLERTILALRGAGVGVRDFGGRDLLGELERRRRSDGSYQRQVNLTAFAILARAAAGADRGSMGASARWLRSAQNRDGGWGSTRGARSEPDSTGSVLQALRVAAPGSRAAENGAGWLRAAQRRDGGWSLTEGAGSNSQSTAWAVQGLLAAGVDPGSVRSGGGSGLSYLASRRRGDGRYSYSRTSDQTPVWVTAQALAAVEGEPFPLDPVPRRPRAAAGGGGSGGGSGPGAAAGEAPRPAASAAGGGPGSSSGGRGSAEKPSDGAAGRGANAGGAKRGSGGSRLPALATSPASALAPEPAGEEGGSALPLTAAALGGLTALALGGGYLLRRRRRS